MTYKQLCEKMMKRERAGQFVRIGLGVLNVIGGIAVLRSLKVYKDSVEE